MAGFRVTAEEPVGPKSESAIRPSGQGSVQADLVAANLVHDIGFISPARILVMARALRADDILPLVDSLTPQERVRLLRLIVRPQGCDENVYRSVPPSRDEFSADDEQLAWEAEGWESGG